MVKQLPRNRRPAVEAEQLHHVSRLIQHWRHMIILIDMSTPGLEGGPLILMASSAFRGKALPEEIAEVLDEAMAREMHILVGEARGCRCYQDCLSHAQYLLVTVGFMRKVRYDVGDWPTEVFGSVLDGKELRMIEECDSTLIIWVNNSGVIGRNIISSKKKLKPIFLYECWTTRSTIRSG